LQLACQKWRVGVDLYPDLVEVLFQGVEEFVILDDLLPSFGDENAHVHHIVILLLKLYHDIYCLYNAISTARNAPGDLALRTVLCHS
jgi:hypothetical protein